MTDKYRVKTHNPYTYPTYQPMRYSEDHGKYVPVQDDKTPSNTAVFYNKKEAHDFVAKRQGYKDLHDKIARKGETE